MAPSRVRIPPSPPRRGGRAVECGGLENRYPSLGGSRVQIPPPPPNPAAHSSYRGGSRGFTPRRDKVASALPRRRAGCATDSRGGDRRTRRLSIRIFRRSLQAEETAG